MGRATKAERYVRLRLDGLGAREAAREVKFAGGVPSPQARRLYRRVLKIQRQPGACEWIRKRREEAEEKVVELRRLDAACELVRELQTEPV